LRYTDREQANGSSLSEALNMKHFWSDEGVKLMKKIEELNKSKLPIVKIDKSLGKYKDQILFKEKVERANETLKSVGLPKTLQKSKA